MGRHVLDVDVEALRQRVAVSHDGIMAAAGSCGGPGWAFLPTGSLQKRKFRYNEHAVPLADIAPSECP